MKIVLVQPALFPWIGTFEKVRLSDLFVHFDDAQFSKGDFTNRTRIKTANGLKWMTVPLQNLHLGQKICYVEINSKIDWRRSHLDFLLQQFKAAQYKADVIKLVERVYSESWTLISDLSIASIEAVCDYFDVHPEQGFIRSSSIFSEGYKSQRVLNIVKCLGGTIYICGSGTLPVAQRYLDHNAFEEQGIRVEYVQYQKLPYPQLYGAFTPNVSILDLIANVGKKGREILASQSIYWKDFMSH